MKSMNFKLSLLALGVVAGGLLTSCTNENEPVINGSGGIILKAPNMVAYSGDRVWGYNSTRSADVNGNLWYQNWDTPQNVTPEEIAKVLEAVKNPIYESNTIKIDWENYWVQQVWKGTDQYNDGNGNGIGAGSDKMNQLLAYNDNLREEVWWPEHVINQGGYEHVNNFNNGSNNTTYTEDWNGTNPGAEYKGTTLMTGMSADDVDAQHQFAYHNTVDSKNHYEYIIIEVDGEYYICFDFFANGTEEYPANKNMDVERDYIYNDWIVKISPAYRAGETPEKPEPGTPEEPDPDQPDQPGDELKQYDEVEINLSLDEKVDRNVRESHLSMHVRSATDVKVFIPIPAAYYCEADDMAILLEHKDDASIYVHGGPYSTEFDINGNIVTLNVEFSADGITIWTDGINQDIIDYCWENYHDGVTFEIWNYFNDPEGYPLISIDELKSYLDRATVEFLDKIPGLYVNAFGREHGRYDESNGNDFHVTPVDDQINSFNDPQQGPHLNDSDFNDLYNKK